MFQWQDNSPFITADVINMSTVAMEAHDVVGYFHSASFAISGSTASEGRQPICTTLCDPQPTQCYQVASLRSKAPLLSLEDTREICASYNETLPILKTTELIAEYLRWHYSDADLVANDAEFVHLGIKWLDETQTQSCNDAACDNELVWDDGSPFVYDDIKLAASRVIYSANQPLIKLQVTADANGGDIIYGSGLAQYAGICTAPCGEPPAPLACYNWFNSFNSDAIMDTPANYNFLCFRFGFTRPVLKSNRAFKEYIAWYHEEAGLLRKSLI